MNILVVVVICLHCSLEFFFSLPGFTKNFQYNIMMCQDLELRLPCKMYTSVTYFKTINIHDEMNKSKLDQYLVRAQLFSFLRKMFKLRFVSKTLNTYNT